MVAPESKIVNHQIIADDVLPTYIGTDYNFKRKIVWKNVIGFLLLHIAGIYGFYLTFYSKLYTVLWNTFVASFLAVGVTMGAHRLYSHKCFKATFSLRLLLIILQTISGQNCMYIWVRDHRQHHKYSDTDADPHNINRGFFFSHIGWLMSKKHPAVIKKSKTIDMSDLEADPLVMFQKEHYLTLYLLFSVFLPVAVPVYFWNESCFIAIFTCYAYRFVLTLNVTWSVNSVAHMYGTRPFDENLIAVESPVVAFLVIGEGWHNYHHAFPWDYRASEFGSMFNLTVYFIELFSYFGLAYDLKSASYNMVKNRVLRTGDGSHPAFGHRKITTKKTVEKVNKAEDEVDENVVEI